MMSPPEVKVTYRAVEDGIAEIAMLDGTTANGMSPEWVDQFVSAVDAARADLTAKVVLLTGRPDHFCTGATVEMLKALASGASSPTELVLGRLLMGIPVPVIAAAEGNAIGGGFALLLSCDLSVIAEESRYGANFMSMGFTPGMGTTRLLEECLGRPLAHEMLYDGDLRRGRMLSGCGGFNAVLPKREVRSKAILMARAIAEKPRASLALLKRVLSLPRRLAFEGASTIESLMHEISFRNFEPGKWGVGQ